MDWRFPGYFDPEGLPENAALMKKQCYDQVEELVTRYGKPDICLLYTSQGEGTIVEEIARSPFAEVSDEELSAMKEELEQLIPAPEGRR